MTEPLLTVDQVAQLTGFSAYTVRAAIGATP